MIVTGASFDDIYYKLLSCLVETPEHVVCPPARQNGTMGDRVHEALFVQLVLLDPRHRYLHCAERKADYGFAAGEFLWYWRGADDLESMLYYNPRMSEFSDDGKTLNSAYGKRLGRGNPHPRHGSQWRTCIETLEKDPDSRRAVMLINEPMDERDACVAGSKDVPCTLSLQFFIREMKLHLHVSMRSNDAWWGLVYDAFSFTLFQECMLLELQKTYPYLELGRYHHTAASMHLYGRHLDQAKKVLTEYRTPGGGAFGFDWNTTYADSRSTISSLRDLSDLAHDEIRLRATAFAPADAPGRLEQIEIDKYSGQLRWLAQDLNVHRSKFDLKKKGR